MLWTKYNSFYLVLFALKPFFVKKSFKSKTAKVMKSITIKSKQLLAGWAAALALLSLNAPPAVAQTSDVDFSLKPLDVDAAIELTFTARGDATTVETVEVECGTLSQDFWVTAQ